MEKEKDNVYEEKNGTEQGMEERTDAEKVRADGGSTGLGKFKDVDALAKAYSALEAEFTRRSQKLRELERMADKFQNASLESGSGAEKLRERAKERREEANKFDEFLREGVKNAAPLVDGNPDVEGSAQEDTEHSSVAAAVGLEKDEKAAAAEKSVEWTADENSQTTAKIAVGVSEMEKTRLPVAEGVDGRIPTEELYRMATKNEKVRLQIIGEYLHSLGKTSAPITAGGVGALATPPRSIRNIQDAGKMALQLFQK